MPRIFNLGINSEFPDGKIPLRLVHHFGGKDLYLKAIYAVEAIEAVIPLQLHALGIEIALAFLAEAHKGTHFIGRWLNDARRTLSLIKSCRVNFRVLPFARGGFVLHKYPGGIPVDVVPPGIAPAEVKLHLDGLIAGIVAGGGNILHQEVIDAGGRISEAAGY